jgi:phospholipid/cholesterol/gamma-HCH transport system substrate-binding protein
LNPASPPNNSAPAVGAPIAGQPPVSGEQMRLRLRQGLDELPDAIHELRMTMQDSRVVLQSANRNFKNLEAFTEPLGAKGSEISDAVLKTVSGLDQIVTDLGSVSKAINNREGTIGRLVHDQQVYENLNRLMFNANKVLGDIDQLAMKLDQMTLNLRPIIADARVLMDKVATEPGRIISGAVKPSVVK